MYKAVMVDSETKNSQIELKMINYLDGTERILSAYLLWFWIVSSWKTHSENTRLFLTRFIYYRILNK